MKQRAALQRGSVALATLVLLGLAVIAISGWLVWQKVNKEDATTTKSSQHQSSDKSMQAVKYLVIDEWGVKLPLSEPIAGAYYEYQSQEDGEFVALYDSNFDSLKNKKGTSCGGENRYQFYSMSRIKKDALATIDIEGADALFRSFPFNDQYLFSGLRPHQSAPPCAHLNLDPTSVPENDTEILTITNQKEEAFDQAFDGLQSAR